MQNDIILKSNIVNFKFECVILTFKKQYIKFKIYNIIELIKIHYNII